jgi:DNA-binding GntR family transcriptional regulator
MLALAREGLVTTIPFRGNFVQWLDPDHVRDIHDARVVIETAAVRQAVAQLNDRDYENLATRIDAIVRAVRAEDYSAAAEEDIAFHSVLYERSGQPILLEMWELIKWRVRFVMVHDIRLRSQQGIAQPERRHQAIMEALRARDPDAAAAAVAAHIQWDGLLGSSEQPARQREGQPMEPPANNGEGAS